MAGGLLYSLWWVISDWLYLRFGNHYADSATVVGQFSRTYAAVMEKENSLKGE